jgi:hypothetical protein
VDPTGAFEWYADWAADVSPLYERLARGVADDRVLLDIANEAREEQPAPQLLFAAVHALLLGGDGNDHENDQGLERELAAFYPTCSDDPLAPTEGAFGYFREFCLANERAVRETVATRSVQTNDVGRSAVLFPAFEYLSRVTGRVPLALVEIGASAGLNLYWDRYRYEYDGHRLCGDPDSPVRIASAVRGKRDPPLPPSPPNVAVRVGIDLNPLDVTDPDDARWLRALVIPDQRERHERLASAIDLVRERSPDIVAGDALDTLPDVLDRLPENGIACVYSTLTTYQLGENGVADLEEVLADRGRKRTIHWLSDDLFAERDRPIYRHVALSDDDRIETRLAEYESYGQWIRWIASPGYLSTGCVGSSG